MDLQDEQAFAFIQGVVAAMGEGESIIDSIAVNSFKVALSALQDRMDFAKGRASDSHNCQNCTHRKYIPNKGYTYNLEDRWCSKCVHAGNMTQNYYSKWE